MIQLHHIATAAVFVGAAILWWLFVRAADELFRCGEMEEQIDPISSTFAWMRLNRVILKSHNRNWSVVAAKWVIYSMRGIALVVVLSILWRMMK
jgi:hypothetical protein